MLTVSENQDLFAERMVRNERRLYGYIVTLLPNRDEAEEVFQEACLTLWKTWAAYDARRDFMSWACGVARNKVKEHVRRRQRQGVSFDDDLAEKLADTRLSVEQTLDARAEALGDCLGKLLTPQRELVERCYSGTQSIKAIAEEMKLAPSALTMRLQRIRKVLLDCVGKVALP
jgi:RNA polymerase sigma-70 factor (ECF subfamily)